MTRHVPDRRIGANGVELSEFAYEEDGYRSYEIHQRERVAQAADKINGMDLASPAYARDPYRFLQTMREHYPCYRDWTNNCYWITRYDDVTSIFTDDANFETRSKRWSYGLEDFGRDLGQDLGVLTAWADAMDTQSGPLAERLVAALDRQRTDLSAELAIPFSSALLAGALALPEPDVGAFATRHWRAQHGAGWDVTAREAGKVALHELVAYFEPLLKERSRGDGGDLVSAVAAAGGSATDLVATILEADHETLFGALASLWMHLLDRPEALEAARGDRRLLKIAYLETLRHSPPVITAERYALREVERFGRLIPRGAQLRLSALAANRDPSLFSRPDDFIADRRDICHREARGQYRADGLPTGISFGLGPPSRFPAVPEDRPRSLFALTRDAAVTVTTRLLEAAPEIRLAEGAAAEIHCLAIGGTYTCWALPCELGPAR